MNNQTLLQFPGAAPAASPRQILAFSGGKDSTALALRLAELGEDFDLLFTPTGNELPDLKAHMDDVVARTGKRLIVPPNQSLEFWMGEFNALPNWRQRWCTRLIKIVPCINYLEANPGCTLIVGLRADEEERVGLWGDYATYRYPFREWGWDIEQVFAYLRVRNVKVPARTDCAFCYGQRLAEWYWLWRNHLTLWCQGEAWEQRTGYTFRSPGRDTWPSSMKLLRAEFEQGRIPRGALLPVLNGEADEPAEGACRVCRF